MVPQIGRVGWCLWGSQKMRWSPSLVGCKCLWSIIPRVTIPIMTFFQRDVWLSYQCLYCSVGYTGDSTWFEQRQNPPSKNYMGMKPSWARRIEVKPTSAEACGSACGSRRWSSDRGRASEDDLMTSLFSRKLRGSRINLPIIRGSWNCRRGRQVGLEELMTSPRCHWLSGLEEPWYRNPWVINRWEIPELNGGFDWQNHRTKRRI